MSETVDNEIFDNTHNYCSYNMGNIGKKQKHSHLKKDTKIWNDFIVGLEIWTGKHR